MKKKRERNTKTKKKKPLKEYVNACLPEPFETNYQVQLSFAGL